MPRYWQQRAPVHRQAWVDVGGIQDRWCQVGVDDRRKDRDTLRDARTAHPQGHAYRLFVGLRLALGYPVLAVEVAIVGREDDQRVVELARSAQRDDQPLDRLIH